MSEAEQSEVDVKQAISIAKMHVSDLFSVDHVKNVGLEEVTFDDVDNTWNITVGFSRPWDTARLDVGIVMNNLFPDASPRTYKIVNISAVNGKINRVTNRPV